MVIDVTTFLLNGNKLNKNGFQIIVDTINTVIFTKYSEFAS